MPEDVGSPQEQQGYFASMADIMAGMVFLVLIMLAAITILTKATSSISTKFLRPKYSEMATHSIEEQRRLAIKHRIALLTQIEHDLEEHGIAARIDDDLGVLRLAASQFFDAGKAIPEPVQQDRLASLLSVLAARLPCYAGNNSPSPPTCPPTDNQRLASVRLDVFTSEKDLIPGAASFRSANQLSQARGVTLLGALFREGDRLLDMRSPSDEQLLKSTAYGPQWVDAPSFDSASHIDLQLMMVMPAELADCSAHSAER